MIDESSVVPGATEEECVPLLERHSGLAFNNSFVVGTRVERVVPCDQQHGFRTITKVTSGSTVEADGSGHQSFGLGLIGLPP